MLQPVIQRPHDLRLVVIQQALLPVLTPLCQSDVTLGCWGVRFGIIGESHQIQVWRDGSPYLAEMLACVDFSASACDHFHRFDRLEAYHYDMPGYNVSVEFAKRPRHRPRCDGRLQFVFPVSNGVLPITEIRWWQVRDMLHWWTLHVYPEADTITYVYSQSLLKID